MKSSTLLSLLILLISMNLFAQSPNETRAVKATETMAKQLDLTIEQKEKVNAAYLNRYRQLSNLDADDTDTKILREEINSTFESALGAILTQSQLEKRNAKSPDQRTINGTSSASRKNKQIQIAATKKTAKMSSQLGLSEVQQIKVCEAYIIQLTKVANLRNQATKDKHSPVESRKKYKKECEATILSILTEEQKKQRTALEQKSKAKRAKITSKQQKSGPNRAKATNEEKADAQADHMAKKLNLTPNQKSSFKSAYLNKIIALEQLNNNNTSDKKAARTKILDEYHSTLNTFLSKKQMEAIHPQKRKHKKID